MTDTNFPARRTQLEVLLAAQAKLYGQVDNPTHFRREREADMRLARTSVTVETRRRYVQSARRANRYLVIEIGKARARNTMPAGKQVAA